MSIKYGIFRKTGQAPLRSILYVRRSDAVYAMGLLSKELGQSSLSKIDLTVLAVDDVTLAIQYDQEEKNRATALGRQEYDPHPIITINSLPIVPSY